MSDLKQLGEKIVEDLKTLGKDLASHVSVTAEQVGKQADDLRAKAADKVKSVTEDLNQRQQKATNAAHSYFAENPDQALGIGVGIGVGIGLAIAAALSAKRDK